MGNACAVPVHSRYCAMCRNLGWAAARNQRRQVMASKNFAQQVRLSAWAGPPKCRCGANVTKVPTRTIAPVGYGPITAGVFTLR